MYYYKFDGDNLIHTLIADEKQEGYVDFGGPVDWTAKRFVNGALQDIPAPPVSEPYVPTVAEVAQQKLYQIDSWTRNAIVGGFSSAASGIAHTYDSTSADQDNLRLMQTVSHFDSFAASAYAGKIPVRAIPTGATEKVVLQLTATQMDALIGDMALHIGAQKQKGWALQNQVAGYVAETTVTPPTKTETEAKAAINAISW